MDTKRSWRLPTFLAVVVMVLVIVGGWWQRYELFDAVRNWRYQPSAAVTSLAEATTMTDRTRRMFYAYHPSLEDKTTFATSCTVTEKTIVLGCYIQNEGIHLYNVTDARLKGVIEVTAAHEALHAAYERLSRSERKRVDALITAAYAKVDNTRIRDTIQSYQDSGADINNELHSILATEVRVLPEELERYYSRYFSDRAVIVSLSDAYLSEFTRREDQVTEADRRLQSLKPEIETLNSSLNTRVKTINAEYARLLALRSSDQIDAYNAGIAAYNQSVSAYNADVKRVQQMIEEYNALVTQRNAIAVEESELSQAIDSRPTAIETQ